MGLITSAYAQTALAELDLSSDQLGRLDAAIAEATRSIQRWCGDRVFERTDWTERHEVAWDGTVLLRQLPVNRISRIAAGRVEALRVENTDDTTNQRATVTFDYAAADDFDLDVSEPRPTGLVLERVASGVTSSQTLDFTTYTTLSSLATAIDGLGNGWDATVITEYEDWPTTELYGGEAAQGALTGVGAQFDLFAEDLNQFDVELDRRAGVLQITRGTRGNRRLVSHEWFGYGSTGLGYAEYGEVLVQYNAGFQTIPTDLQAACVETVKAILTGNATDPNLASERGGDYSYKLRDSVEALGAQLPPSAKRLAAPYRIHRS